MPKVTSAYVASIASRGLAAPEHLTHDEIQMVCGSSLAQFEPPYAHGWALLIGFLAGIATTVAGVIVLAVSVPV